MGKEAKEVVVQVLAAEILALPRAEAHGATGEFFEISRGSERAAAVNVDAAPQLRLVARHAAPGAAHRGHAALEELNQVELAEDVGDRVQRQLRPVPYLGSRPAAASAGTPSS